MKVQEAPCQVPKCWPKPAESQKVESYSSGSGCCNSLPGYSCPVLPQQAPLDLAAGPPNYSSRPPLAPPCLCSFGLHSWEHHLDQPGTCIWRLGSNACWFIHVPCLMSRHHLPQGPLPASPVLVSMPCVPVPLLCKGSGEVTGRAPWACSNCLFKTEAPSQLTDAKVEVLRVSSQACVRHTQPPIPTSGAFVIVFNCLSAQTVPPFPETGCWRRLGVGGVCGGWGHVRGEMGPGWGMSGTLTSLHSKGFRCLAAFHTNPWKSQHLWNEEFLT